MVEQPILVCDGETDNGPALRAFFEERFRPRQSNAMEGQVSDVCDDKIAESGHLPAEPLLENK